MNFLDYPQKKKYIEMIKTQYGLVMLEFKQATIEETMEFLNNGFDEQWLEDILFKNSIVVKKKWRYSKKKLLKELEKGLEQILKIVVEKRFVFKKGKSWWWRQQLFSGLVQLVCNNYWIKPKELLEEYTWEQFEWMIDWVIFNLNEQTKEWQRLNDVKLRKQVSTKSNEELLAMLRKQNGG